MSVQGPQHVVVVVKFGFAFLLISLLATLGQGANSTCHDYWVLCRVGTLTYTKHTHHTQGIIDASLPVVILFSLTQALLAISITGYI